MRQNTLGSPRKSVASASSKLPAFIQSWIIEAKLSPYCYEQCLAKSGANHGAPNTHLPGFRCDAVPQASVRELQAIAKALDLDAHCEVGLTVRGSSSSSSRRVSVASLGFIIGSLLAVSILRCMDKNIANLCTVQYQFSTMYQNDDQTHLMSSSVAPPRAMSVVVHLFHRGQLHFEVTEPLL